MTLDALWGNLGNQLPRQVYTGIHSFLLSTLIIVWQAPFYENLASPLVNELWVWELVHFWKLDKGSCFLLEKLNLALCSSILDLFLLLSIKQYTCWLPIYFASRKTMIHVPFSKIPAGQALLIATSSLLPVSVIMSTLPLTTGCYHQISATLEHSSFY